MNALLSLYVYVKSCFEAEDGQDLIEYALIIALFVIVAVAGITALNAPMASIWSSITSKLTVAP